MKLILFILLMSMNAYSYTVTVGYPSSTKGMTYSKVSGNSYFHSTVNNWSSTNRSKYALFNVNTNQRGFYKLEANVIANSGTSNSFFVKVNHRFPNSWNSPTSAKARFNVVNNEIYLKKGLNKVYFYPREKNTKIGDIRAVYLRNASATYFESFWDTKKKHWWDVSHNANKYSYVNGKLRSNYVPYQHGSERLTWNKTVTKRNDYTLSFTVTFSNNFEFVKGGKLHGMGPMNPTTGCKSPVSEGWSNRIMWRENGRAYLYVYSQDRENPCGSDFASNFYFKKGGTYKISLYTKLNSSSSRSDGVSKLYINGKQVAEAKGLKFRNSTSEKSKIQKFLFSTFHGGNDKSWSPSRTITADFDNIQMIPGDFPGY